MAARAVGMVEALRAVGTAGALSPAVDAALLSVLEAVHAGVDRVETGEMIRAKADPRDAVGASPTAFAVVAGATEASTIHAGLAPLEDAIAAVGHRDTLAAVVAQRAKPGRAVGSAAAKAHGPTRWASGSAAVDAGLEAVGLAIEAGRRGGASRVSFTVDAAITPPAVVVGAASLVERAGLTARSTAVGPGLGHVPDAIITARLLAHPNAGPVGAADPARAIAVRRATGTFSTRRAARSAAVAVRLGAALDAVTAGVGDHTSSLARRRRFAAAGLTIRGQRAECSFKASGAARPTTIGVGLVAVDGVVVAARGRFAGRGAGRPSHAEAALTVLCPLAEKAVLAFGAGASTAIDVGLCAIAEGIVAGHERLTDPHAVRADPAESGLTVVAGGAALARATLTFAGPTAVEVGLTRVDLTIRAVGFRIGWVRLAGEEGEADGDEYSAHDARRG